jgi:axin 1
MEKRLMRENVLANEDTMAHAMVIPRTQRLDAKKNHTLLPIDMMKILMPKLEALQREQANDEILSKKLNEVDPYCFFLLRTNKSIIFLYFQAQSDDKSKSNKSLADAIREKFQVDDDNDQDILDQHVSRVWSDLTPSRSPGTSSPCPTNLNSRRRTHDLGFGPAPGLTSKLFENNQNKI